MQCATFAPRKTVCTLKAVVPLKSVFLYSTAMSLPQNTVVFVISKNRNWHRT